MIMIILIVSLGVLVAIMVFCFAKRQITRFALKSGKSLHEPIGQNAPKALLLEIERRLKRVKDITIEPQLIPPEMEEKARLEAETSPQTYYYRMKTLDLLPKLYAEIKKCNPNATKKVCIPLRVFLLEQRQAGCLEGVRLEAIEKFCSLYDHARHSPKIFTVNEYMQFTDILRLFQNYIQLKTRLITSTQTPVSPGQHSERSDGSLKRLLSTENPMAAGLGSLRSGVLTSSQHDKPVEDPTKLLKNTSRT